MITIIRSSWCRRIGNKWNTRNGEENQVIHSFSENPIERWGKIVAKCGTMGKLILESDNIKEVTCEKCLFGEIGRHLK